MLAIQKWAENKPLLIAFFAPQVAVIAEDMHQAFRQIRERRIFNYQYPLPPLLAWFTLYRSHQKALAFLRSLFVGFSAFSTEAIELGETIFEMSQMIHRGKITLDEYVHSADEIKRIQAIFLSVLDTSFQEMQSDFSNNPVDPSVKEAFKQLLSEKELESSFYTLVVAPCWLLYRTHPTRLYRKARLGDIEALEKLLRLDPLMLHDPAIGNRIQALRFANKTAAYENLLEAPLKRPKTRITRKKIKYSMAGLISALATIIKQPLTEPEIRALFDAVAQDTNGSPIDTDLPDSPEAFARAISRDRSLWIQTIMPDKKK